MTIEEKVEDLSKQLHELVKTAVIGDVKKMVTEVCPHCGNENEIAWDVEKQGYEMFCSCCGEKMMICSQCPEADSCDWCKDQNGKGNCKMMLNGDILKNFWFKKDQTYFELDGNSLIDCGIVNFPWNGNQLHYSSYHSEEFAKIAQKIKRFNDKLLAFKWCYDRDYKPDLEDDDEKYKIYFDHKTNRYLCTMLMHLDSMSVYFSSKKIAQMCCDWLNKEEHTNGD